MSDNWYIVNTSGSTQGPLNETTLINLYLNETIHSKTYVWNGQTVKEWIPIMKAKYIYDKIKHLYVHQPNEVDMAIQNQIKNLLSQSEQTQKETTPKNLGNTANEKTTTCTDDTSTSEYISDEIDHHKIDDDNLKTLQFKNEQKEDTQTTHNKPSYPSKLQRNSDRKNLMANIRNGIMLRDENTSNSKQNKSKQPPKRLKDKFQQNAAEFTANSEQQSFIKQQYLAHDNDNNEEHRGEDRAESSDFSLSTSIDQDLITRVKQKGYYNNRMDKVVRSSEVSERASLIRQRFGEVHVVSGKGRKKDISNNQNVNVSEQAKECNSISGEFANRIAKLKYKLDQVTDNESWIVTRIENVFLAANK